MAEEQDSAAVEAVLAMLMATMALVAWPRAKSAQLVALVAEAAALAPEPCHMWELGRASTCRRQPTSTSVVAATSTLFAPEEISRASSACVACRFCCSHCCYGCCRVRRRLSSSIARSVP